MKKLLKFLGFGKRKTQILEYLKQSAIIVDVRTVEEYKMGHIKSSKNIALHNFEANVKSLKRENVPVITCCRSGQRSGIASNILKRHGIINVNGGSWTSLKKIIDSY